MVQFFLTHMVEAACKQATVSTSARCFIVIDDKTWWACRVVDFCKNLPNYAILLLNIGSNLIKSVLCSVSYSVRDIWEAVRNTVP